VSPEDWGNVAVTATRGVSATRPGGRLKDHQAGLTRGRLGGLNIEATRMVTVTVRCTCDGVLARKSGARTPSQVTRRGANTSCKTVLSYLMFVPNYLCDSKCFFLFFSSARF
jgi:hypothetical protein